MSLTRRQTLRMAATTLIGGGLASVAPFAARAQSQMEGDTYDTDGGEMVVHPVSHASFVLAAPGLVIYNDPVGGAVAYDGLPRPDLILITHEHSDHYDVDTLNGLAGPDTRMVVNPAVYDMLPEALKAKATPLANGESTTVDGVSIDAVPAYNLTEERLQYHPPGRDNGYLLGIDGRRVYIAGDTEDIPEMRALDDIDVAFVPMNLPYTMTVEQAADAVTEFAPSYVYPYHYKGSDIDAFADMVVAAAASTEVVKRDWYA